MWPPSYRETSHPGIKLPITPFDFGVSLHYHSVLYGHLRPSMLRFHRFTSFHTMGYSFFAFQCDGQQQNFPWVAQSSMGWFPSRPLAHQIVMWIRTNPSKCRVIRWGQYQLATPIFSNPGPLTNRLLLVTEDGVLDHQWFSWVSNNSYSFGDRHS